MPIGFIKDVSVDCDFPDCIKSADSLLTKSQVWMKGIRELQKIGWKIDLTTNKAFCPEHAKEGQE